MASLSENVERTIQNFDAIKEVLIQNDISVPENTPVEKYSEMLSESMANKNTIISEQENTISEQNETIDELNYTKEQNEADFAEIKTAISAKGVDITDDTPTSDYAEKVDEVYSAGKEAEYNNFWTYYQKEQLGSANLQYAYAGMGWRRQTFKPKSNIKPYRADKMFALFNYRETSAYDMAEALEKLGVVLDFSNCINMTECFQQSKISRLGTIDISKSTNNYYTFNSENLKTIDKLIVSESTPYNSTFGWGGSTLENLTVEGVIGKNGFSVSVCSKLTVDSLLSILNALQDKTEDTSGTIWKVTLGSTNTAKLTEEELNIAYEKGWTVA